ncbi:MAG: hypothetical protein P8Q92_10950 [Pseudoprimorskyibacter sp.]|jgi:hypothetical protein|nr:hypothetical protein [Pseudoprimorskyibacter sp.]
MKKIVLAAAFAGFAASAAMADGPSVPEMDDTVVIETTESSAQGSSGGLLMPLLLLAAVAALAS